MPSEVAEPPVIETPPPQEPEYVPPPKPEKPALKVKAGDIFKTEFAKLTKAEGETPKDTPPPPAEKPVETPKEEPKPEVTEPEKPAAESPKSPLDVVTADKPEVKKEPEEEDVLKQFSETDPDWKKAREVMKTQSREKRELANTIAELKKTPKSDPEEIARLKQEIESQKQVIAEREELIKSVDVRLSDEYRSLAKKRDDTVGKIAHRAKSYGVDPDALVSALALPDGRFKTEQIKGILSEVDPDDKTRINVLIETLEEHNEAISEFEREAPKKYEEIQAKREAAVREQQENSVKAIQSEFGKVSDSLPTDIVTLREVSEDIPGGTEWNQAIKSAKENALRILSPGGSDFNESASIAVKGAHYDALMKMFLKDHQELVDARKRLSEYDSGGPDFKGSSKPVTQTKQSPVQKYYKALETIKADPTE